MKPVLLEGRVVKHDFKVELLDGSRVSPVGFKFPAMPRGSEKLYMVTVRGGLVYVGVTRRRIRDRIRYGLRHDPGKSRYGYKWRDEGGLLGLHVWVADPPRDDEEKNVLRDFAEAVEAEIAGLHRHLTGRWPRCQNEIHFHNVPGAAKVAARLYAEMGGY